MPDRRPFDCSCIGVCRMTTKATLTGLAKQIEIAPDGRSLTILGELAGEEAGYWRRTEILAKGDEFALECAALAEKFEVMRDRAEARKAALPPPQVSDE